ncbi:MAG: L,D-transpeptidase family protein [Xanthobacteraceae bacterium]
MRMLEGALLGRAPCLVVLCAFVLAMSSNGTSAREDHGACAEIRAACLTAGFVQGAAREGVGLQMHCMMPIMQARPQPATARKALPKINAQLVAQCRTSNLRFGPALSPPGDILEPPTGSVPSTGSAARDVPVRPPSAINAEQRAMIAALPPEDQPETGPAKALPAPLRRTSVDYPSKEAVGTIIIDTAHTYLYVVLGNGKAMRYGIGVGREGFTWSGAEKITRMAEWPDWNPPQEMIERQPYLPRFMAGGEGNPLGARALYLGQTLYRIHGTNQPSTIGTFVSSGCIRLTNEDIADLYGRVQVGTRVVVLPTSGAASSAAQNLAQPAKPRPKAAAKPIPTPAAVSQQGAVPPAPPSRTEASATTSAPTAPSAVTGSQPVGGWGQEE